MAKQIGNLAVVISANTAALTRGLSSAKNLVLGFTAAMGVGFSVQGLRNIAEDIDHTAKTADQLGVLTESLIGLRHGANLAGVGAEAFDASFTTMVKNVSMAGRGLGKAKVAIADLNLHAGRLAGLSAESQLKAIAEAMQEIQSPTERARIAMQLFGGEGRKMISVLQGGAAAIEQAQAEAERLGMTYGRIDAAKVEAANDSMTRLQGVLTGVAQTLVIQVAPYIQATTEQLIDLGTQGNKSTSLVTAGLETIATSIAYAADVVDLFKLAWVALKLKWYDVEGALLGGLIKVQEGVISILDQFSNVLPASIKEGVQRSMREFEKMQTQSAVLADETAAQFDEMLVGKSASEKVTEFFDNARRRAEEVAKEIASAAPRQSQIFDEDVYAGLRGQMEDVKKAAKDVRDAFEFKNPSLIYAGSARAQGFGSESLLAELNRSEKARAERDKQQLQELRKIAQNTENIGDDGEVLDAGG